MFNLSRKGQLEFLDHLAANQAAAFIETSMARWLSNQLPAIGKYDVTARDLTVVSHVRNKSLKHFVPEFTADEAVRWSLLAEIDDLLLAYTTASTDAYIALLKEKIEDESHFSAQIIATAPSITYVYDVPSGTVAYISAKVEEVLGYTPAEIRSLDNVVAALIHPDDIPVMQEELVKVMADDEGKTYYSDYRFRSRDGSLHWLRNYAVVYHRDQEGRPTQLLGSAYDVTQEKLTSLALQKRESQLLEAQAIGRTGSFEWDIINDHSESSPELRKIFETTHRQTLAQMMERVHPQDRDQLREAINESFRSGIYHAEFRYIGKDAMKVIESNGRVSYTEDGRPATLIGTIQDITERKRAEEILTQKSRDLEQSNAYLQEFAYVASHDLKEPLRKIGMFSNIILSTDWDHLTDKTKINFEKINDAARRMQQLIEGILSYSSLTSQISPERYPLQAALDEALSNLEFRIREAGATITGDPLPEADVVPFQMQQLFQNLLSNALKFARRDVPPVIRITHRYVNGLPGLTVLETAHTYLEISVADNGIGFNDPGGDKVFGLFKRMHDRSAYEGSGVGLAICRKIVENHGGTISASSILGEGSVFTFTLPA
ncbi:MAG: domain S-box protein [Flaviaesturariibacter sp.]|nr:domain S-box protein [Flaviaesturariibacter sp.]